MGITSHAIAGVVAFTVFASGALAQMALSPLKPVTLLKAGSPTLLAGLTLLVVAMWTADLAIFVIGTVVTGVGAALIFRGSMATAAESAPPESRAEALAGFFLGAYVGLSVPIVALGIASGYASARTLMLIFVLAVAVAMMVSVRSVVRKSIAPAPVRTSVPGPPAVEHSLPVSTKYDDAARRVGALRRNAATARSNFEGDHESRRWRRESHEVLSRHTQSTQVSASAMENDHER